MSFHIETYRKDTLIILGQVSNQSVISDYLENNRIGNDMSLNLITELTKLRGKFHIVKFPLIDLIINPLIDLIISLFFFAHCIPNTTLIVSKTDVIPLIVITMRINKLFILKIFRGNHKISLRKIGEKHN